MEDFSGLASSLAAGVSDVRGCLIVSRDGLVLGSHPEEGEAQAKSAWLRFAELGDPERGFAQFGTEIWCYVRRGPYAAFAVVGLGARPGLVIDHMEQVLLAAEETRNSREGVRMDTLPPVPNAPTTKPRTPLHPLEEPVVITADVAATSLTAAGSAETPSASAPVPPAEGSPRSEGEGAGPAEEAHPEHPDTSGKPRGNVWGEEEDEEGDVDRFSLAREFGQLLQDGEGGADG